MWINRFLLKNRGNYLRQFCGPRRLNATKPLRNTNSFVMNLFNGKLNTSEIFPFPEVLTPEMSINLKEMSRVFDDFIRNNVKSAEYDEKEKFDDSILHSLGELGAYGIQAPEELNGLNLNNTAYGQLVTVLGMYDLALGTHIGAHQGIGYKGILLFGTEQQKAKYVPGLASGNKFAAFCLTEPGSGSDASSIQTKAVLSADGDHYLLNGTKIWITNGGIADIFTVFAKVPVEKSPGVFEDKMTAFIVERKFGGLTHSEPEKKMGIKASNTTSLYFDDCKVPVENVLGNIGDGFKIAVQTLNQGRFSMAASMAGTIRSTISQVTDHVLQRKQFGKYLHEFENVQEKLSQMAVKQYVTESLAFLLSGAMDLGSKDYQLEAAISKIYSSEAAWTSVDEAIQIFGGIGFMRQTGLERTMRDLRIFRIFEGANDVLRLFVVLTGLNYAGKHLSAQSKSVTGMANIAADKVGRFMGVSGEGKLIKNYLPVELHNSAKEIGQLFDVVSGVCRDLLIKYNRTLLDKQYRLIRLSNAVIQLYGALCVLSRCALVVKKKSVTVDYELAVTRLACSEASKLIEGYLKDINLEDDDPNLVNIKLISSQICAHGGVLSVPPPNI